MLNHVVLLKFKPGVAEADIDELEKQLDALPNSILEIQMYEFGRDVVKSERSYDFAIVSLFANETALERYLTHGEHVRVAAKLKQLCENIITVDFFGTDAGSLRKDEDRFDL
jgi:hypothetical protein